MIEESCLTNKEQDLQSVVVVVFYRVWLMNATSVIFPVLAKADLITELISKFFKVLNLYR